MRIAALISFFDERPEELRECIRSLAGHVDHIVAIDGAYGLFPNGRPYSDPTEHKAVLKTCQQIGVGCTLEIPPRVWDTEMEKRTRLFELAATVTEDGDWWFVMDADQRLKQVPDDLREQLAGSAWPAATVTFDEPHPNAEGSRFPVRCLFRHCPGLRVERNHYSYVTPDGFWLWGNPRHRGAKSAAHDLREQLIIEHRTHFRRKDRKDRATAYYKQRDDLAIEVGSCEYRDCTRPAHKEIPFDWLPHPDGLSSHWLAVCPDCEPIARQEGNEMIRSYGLDPALMQVTFKKAEPPGVPA